MKRAPRLQCDDSVSILYLKLCEDAWKCNVLGTDQRKDISSFLIVQSFSLIGRARHWVSWQTQNRIPLPGPQGSQCSQVFGSRDMTNWPWCILMPGGSRDAEKPTFQANVGRCVLLTPTSIPVCMEVFVQDSRLSPFVFRSISAIQRRFVRFYYCADMCWCTDAQFFKTLSWCKALILTCGTRTAEKIQRFGLFHSFILLHGLFYLEADQRGGPARFKHSQWECLVAWALRWKRLRWPGVWREAPGLASRSLIILIGQPRHEKQADCAETNWKLTRPTPRKMFYHVIPIWIELAFDKD